jgi:hypothetical protein
MAIDTSNDGRAAYEFRLGILAILIDLACGGGLALSGD